MPSQEMVERVGEGVPKHDKRSFLAAMDLAGVSHNHPYGCVLLDDLTANLKVAKELGWRTVRIGHMNQAEGCADTTVARVHDIRWAFPDLFGLHDPFRHCIGMPTSLSMHLQCKLKLLNVTASEQFHELKEIKELEELEEVATVCVSEPGPRNKRGREPKQGSPPPRRCLRRIASS